MKTSYAFSRRGPDKVAESLAGVLSKGKSFEFKALFTIVHDDLKSRNAASGGEEMLRLRAYEKLQNLVQAGIVEKTGKEYRGNAAALVTFLETSASLNTKAPMPATAPAPAPAKPVAAKPAAAAKSVAASKPATAVAPAAPKSRRRAPVAAPR